MLFTILSCSSFVYAEDGTVPKEDVIETIDLGTNVTGIYDADNNALIVKSNNGSLNLSKYRSAYKTYKFEKFLMSDDSGSMGFTPNCQYFFQGQSKLTEIDTRFWDVYKTYNFDYMFYGCSNLKKISLNMSFYNARTMSHMFQDCTSLKELDVNFNTGPYLSDTTSMFEGCTSLERLHVNIGSSVSYLSFMFCHCYNLKSLQFDFIGNNTKEMGSLFNGCKSLEELDLSKLSIGSGTSTGNMFNNCDSLRVLYTPKAIYTSESVKLESPMYDENGGTVKALPTNGSIKLVRNYEDLDANTPGFFIGRDSNAFVNHYDPEYAPCFLGQKNYEISDELYNALTKGLTKGQKSSLKESLNASFSGACHGITVTMGLLYNNLIDIRYLTDKDGKKDYYSIGDPAHDPKLKDVVLFHHMLQSGTYTGATHHSSFLSWLLVHVKHSDPNRYLSQKEFFQRILKCLDDNNSVGFAFSLKKGGYAHSVLAIDYRYDSSRNKYYIKIFDCNSVKSDGTSITNKGKFSTLEVSKDFSNFSFTDDNGYEVSEKTFFTMAYYDFSKLRKDRFIPSSSGDVYFDALTGDEESSTQLSRNADTLVVEVGKPFCITNDSGKKVAFNGVDFTGELELLDLDMRVNDGKQYFVISVEHSNNYTINGLDKEEQSRFEIYNKDEYASAEIKNIESANIVLGKKVTLIGGAGSSFKVSMSTDETDNNDNGLITICAMGNDTVHITRNADCLTAESDAELCGIQVTNYIGQNTTVKKYANTDQIRINSKGEKKSIEYGADSGTTAQNSIVTAGYIAKNSNGTFKVLSVKNKTVTLIKSKNKRKVTVPATIKIRGVIYKVVQINKKAFSGNSVADLSV